MIGIRDEYSLTFGRQNLTLWQGAFCSEFVGSAQELPGHDGFMLTLDHADKTIRVSCPAPRTDENFEIVDETIRAAIKSGV